MVCYRTNGPPDSSSTSLTVRRTAALGRVLRVAGEMIKGKVPVSAIGLVLLKSSWWCVYECVSIRRGGVNMKLFLKRAMATAHHVCTSPTLALRAAPARETHTQVPMAPL